MVETTPDVLEGGRDPEGDQGAVEPAAVDRPLTETERARLEDPDFAVVRAKAIARGRGEVYNPERHGPFTGNEGPRYKPDRPTVTKLGPTQIDEILARFKSYGGPRLVRDFKIQASNDK